MLPLSRRRRTQRRTQLRASEVEKLRAQNVYEQIYSFFSNDHMYKNYKVIAAPIAIT